MTTLQQPPRRTAIQDLLDLAQKVSQEHEAACAAESLTDPDTPERALATRKAIETADRRYEICRVIAWANPIDFVDLARKAAFLAAEHTLLHKDDKPEDLGGQELALWVLSRDLHIITKGVAESHE